MQVSDLQADHNPGPSGGKNRRSRTSMRPTLRASTVSRTHSPFENLPQPERTQARSYTGSLVPQSADAVSNVPVYPFVHGLA